MSNFSASSGTKQTASLSGL